MGPKRKRAAADPSPVERDMRDQEVIRANRELAAYFRGRRTEREARARSVLRLTFARRPPARLRHSGERASRA